MTLKKKILLKKKGFYEIGDIKKLWIDNRQIEHCDVCSQNPLSLFFTDLLTIPYENEKIPNGYGARRDSEKTFSTRFITDRGKGIFS